MFDLDINVHTEAETNIYWSRQNIGSVSCNLKRVIKTVCRQNDPTSDLDINVHIEAETVLSTCWCADCSLPIGQLQWPTDQSLHSLAHTWHLKFLKNQHTNIMICHSHNGVSVNMAVVTKTVFYYITIYTSTGNTETCNTCWKFTDIGSLLAMIFNLNVVGSVSRWP